MINLGQTVGNYNITAKLGEGGMGTVFLAEHPVIGSKIALKAIHPQFASDVEVVSRFVNEAKAVNRIGHDHIVDITDFGTTEAGDFYFMMEYLQGDSLSALIRRGGLFPPARALNIAAQIAEALQASHDHGVIHRDLKPDNVFLIARDGTLDFVKILDFGVAKLTSPQDAVTHNTCAGSLIGTPYYMSPEQCEGKVEVDNRSDIYSLGVILFEMLTGMIPFGGKGFGEIIVKHLTVPPPSARSIVPGLPAALDALLFRALSKDPAQRFQSMAEFQAALLNPDEYAQSQPSMGLPDRFSGRFQAALPMARSGNRLRQAAVTTLEPAGEPVSVEWSRFPSTLNGSAGEIDQDLRPARAPVRLAQVVVVLSMAALAGMALASMVGRQPAAAKMAVAGVPAAVPGGDATLAYLAAQPAPAPAAAPPAVPAITQPAPLPFVNSPAVSRVKKPVTVKVRPPARKPVRPYDDDGVLELSVY